jgi:hypothetical protein
MRLSSWTSPRRDRREQLKSHNNKMYARGLRAKTCDLNEIVNKPYCRQFKLRLIEYALYAHNLTLIQADSTLEL